MSSVVTRFAPSPTGNLHSGAYRTAIFSYLFARKNHGTFVLRIEDTDRERSKPEYEKNILDSLAWLGLDYDVFVRQSENVERHREVLEKMIADGHAYVSREEAKDGSGVIKEIVRFRNPGIDVTFHDEVKGEVTMHTGDLGDFVIAKNIREPLFHLAVVVDDFDAGVTHVIRGEDHVSNTPRQILIQRAIGAPTPIYAHLPLVLGTDKQKLSKRRGALALTEYRDLGYLPAAILNMISMIGWNPGTEQELFTKDQLVDAFELSHVQKSPAVFNPEKLLWVNRQYLVQLSDEQLIDGIKPFLDPSLHQFLSPIVVSVLRERLNTFGEVSQVFGTDLAFLSGTQPEPAKIPWKDESAEATVFALRSCQTIIESLSEHPNPEDVKSAIWPLTETAANGRGSILWPLRYGLTGQQSSPDPFTVIAILGRDESLSRIQAAITCLGNA